MERITDFSFSGICDLINGCEQEAANVIYQCAIQKEECDAEIAELEQKLRSVKSEREGCVTGAMHAMRKIKNRDFPFYIMLSDCVVIVNENSATIERNVLTKIQKCQLSTNNQTTI